MSNSNTHIVHRVTLPTAYSYEPYGTQWRYIDTDGRERCYIQMSRDTSVMYWMKFSELLEHVFYEKLLDESFMNKVMNSFTIKE